MKTEKNYFLEKCGIADREKLLGKRKMSFEDYEKFIFLAGHFKLSELEKELYHAFAKDFQGKCKELLSLWEAENWEEAVEEEIEEELEKRERWIQEFVSRKE